MKYIGILAIALLGASGLYAQNVNIPDANFKTYLVGNVAINTNGDGEISVAEAAAFSGTINCSNLGIADLTGIEAFTSLTVLDCSSNNLTALDVSKNVDLTFLNCRSNNLTVLDVSNNTALTMLWCYWNKLITLDVSINTSLISLICSSNNLTVLDVSNNTALTRLECNFNNLTTLNVSNNTALTTLKCHDNKLTALDVSNNIALTRLDCYFNNLTSLDVSNNTTLTLLSCSRNNLTTLGVSNNTALANLDCSFNNLTTLDVSNNTTLTSLDCSSNNLTVLDVSQNIALVWLFCNNNELLGLNMKNASTTKLINFNATGNALLKCIEVDDATAATAAWTNIDSQTSFSSTGCPPVNIPDANFKAYLVGNNLINTDGNAEISIWEAAAFAGTINCSSLGIADLAGIEAFTNLTGLNCASNNLSMLDISQNKSLTNLDCTDNDLSELDLKTFSPEILSTIHTTGNAKLWCIEVDDAVASTAAWTDIDTHTSFSENCLIAGTDTQFQQVAHVYPNPTTGQVNIELKNSFENATIVVRNSMGQVVLSRSTTHTANELVSIIIPGASDVYFIEVLGANGERENYKIIKN